MARRCADLPLNRFSAGDPPPARWRCRRGWSGRPNHEMTPSGCSGSRPHRNHRLDRGPQHRATPFRARLQAPAAYGRTSGTRSSSPRCAAPPAAAHRGSTSTSSGASIVSLRTLGMPRARLGGDAQASATTRSATSGPSGGTRDGRVLSRRSPSTPSLMNRACQRQTQGFDLPVRRMIPAVPKPSAVARMMPARHTSRAETISPSR